MKPTEAHDLTSLHCCISNFYLSNRHAEALKKHRGIISGVHWKLQSGIRQPVPTSWYKSALHPTAHIQWITFQLHQPTCRSSRLASCRPWSTTPFCRAWSEAQGLQALTPLQLNFICSKQSSMPWVKHLVSSGGIDLVTNLIAPGFRNCSRRGGNNLPFLSWEIMRLISLTHVIGNDS